MLDADEVFPNIWQGSQPPLGSVVAEHGFDVLVLCAVEWQPDASEFTGVEVLHAPFDDSCGGLNDIYPRVG